MNALPTISVAIRNNAIVDATESSWKQAQLQKVGNLSSIFSDNHWIKYADSWLPALNNAEYFQATGTAYPSSASSVNCISDEGDDVGLDLSKGELAACVFVPTVFVLLILVGFCLKWMYCVQNVLCALFTHMSSSFHTYFPVHSDWIHSMLCASKNNGCSFSSKFKAEF